jgi:hypothetical protein
VKRGRGFGFIQAGLPAYALPVQAHGSVEFRRSACGARLTPGAMKFNTACGLCLKVTPAESNGVINDLITTKAATINERRNDIYKYQRHRGIPSRHRPNATHEDVWAVTIALSALIEAPNKRIEPA